MEKGISGSFAERLIPDGRDGQKRKETVERCQRVVRTLFEWAKRSGVEILDIKKLGGGYQNLVLEIHTSAGQSLVAKAFSEQIGAKETRAAQSALSEIADRDMPIVPEAVAWADDTTLVSEKAEGASVRQVLDDVVKGERDRQEAIDAFTALGATLGTIHERTERPFTAEEAAGGPPDLYRYDAKRIRDDIDHDAARRILKLDPEALAILKASVGRITRPGHVSLIHGDAHLDQFFAAPKKSHVMIVDYDKYRFGDPMADVARAVASLRGWAWILKAPIGLEQDLISALLKGYQGRRKESLRSERPEFDQMKVIAYELRHYLMLIRWNQEKFGILDAIAARAGRDYPDPRDFFVARLTRTLSDEALLEYGFNEEDAARIDETAHAIAETEEVARYLSSITKKSD